MALIPVNTSFPEKFHPCSQFEYKVHFYRKTDGWYDGVRYDSHEIKKGRKVLAPHLHLKLATPFKEPRAGEAELQEVIAAILPKLKELTG